jgi:hypothetical protein
MLTSRVQELMTQGYALSNKFHFGQLNEDEFQPWVEACYDIIAACKPEPCFPSLPNHRHIEEIVMILMHTLHRILRGEIEYQGLL